jgi:hypothetical protein
MSVRSTLPAAEPRRKENQFVNKRGHKHHNYPPGKAPYPISYDRDLLDRSLTLNSTSTLSRTSKLFSVSDAMDHHLWRGLFDGRPTMTVTPNYPPKRVLDLGCGVRHLSCNSVKSPEEPYRLACGPLMQRASGPMRRWLASISSIYNSPSIISTLLSLAG